MRVWLAFALILITLGSANAAPPFRLSRTEGRCRDCQTATSLSEVDFVSKTEAWAIGFRPPGETGTGDYSILHTRDGGRSWHELPGTYAHNMAPHLSFVRPREGWRMEVNIVEAENALFETGDGGAHWRKLDLTDLFVDDIQDLGGGRGVADAFDIYKKAGTLLATSDDWRHHTTVALPAGFFPGGMTFADTKAGLVAGCRNGDFTMLATADGGAHWQATVLPLLVRDRVAADNCPYEADDLSLAGARNGWLLVSKHSFRTGDKKGFAAIFHTPDGGAHWSQSWSSASEGEMSRFFYSLRFLDENTGVASFTDHDKNMLLYTTDAGAHWQTMQIPYPVGACQNGPGGLACSTSGFGALWIRR